MHAEKIAKVFRVTASRYDVAAGHIPVVDGAPRKHGRNASDARAVASYILQAHYGVPTDALISALNCTRGAVYSHVRNVEAGPRLDVAAELIAVLDPPRPRKQPAKPDIYASPHKPPRGPQPPERERMAHLAGYR